MEAASAIPATIRPAIKPRPDLIEDAPPPFASDIGGMALGTVNPHILLFG
jgi:hypothetical protein